MVGLTLIGSLSPLLTFEYLWQLKEWRLDRLREHMRAEGIIRSIFGSLRIPILIAFFALAFLTTINQLTALYTLLAIFACATLLQKLIHRQPEPVWTQKARALTALAFVITFAFAVARREDLPALSLLIVLQPLIVFAAWMLLYPVDRILKMRIMKRAKQIRAKFPDLTVIGITGSAGKTTTKELLAHVLKDKSPLTTPEHVNTELGVSKWLIDKLSKKDAVPEILIVEMGAYAPGEIAMLCDIVQPNIGITTFIGSQHIALFGSQESLQRAKGELTASIPPHGMVFLNADSELCTALKKYANCEVLTVGTGGHADEEAFDVEEISTGIKFKLDGTMFEIPLHGTHNVTNVMLAISVAKTLEMPIGDIANILKSFRPLKRTFDVRIEGDVTILDDTHNSSPASFKAAIAWARNQQGANKVLLTSGLIELGMKQDRMHTELGNLSSSVFDRVIFLSARSAVSFQKGYGKEVELYKSGIKKVPKETLLVCEGRMSEQIIRTLLPE